MASALVLWGGVPHFALLSLGSSPSEEEEGDGEGPGCVLPWWLGNRPPP